MLAAVEAGLPVVEYTPAEIKRAVVGYGRAEKHQVQQMMKLMLGLTALPSPHDAADALAVAICHVHSHVVGPRRQRRCAAAREGATSWRHYRPATIVIAHLRGRLLEKQPNRIVVDVDGVGYDVSVPLSTFYGLGEAGSEIALRIHTHVREDALLLYGFATALEQQLFERLISVSGIGPKVALAVLSGIEPSDLIRAIERERHRAADGDSRCRKEDGRAHRPGTEGSAAARRSAPRPAVPPRPSRRRSEHDVLSALINLGYHRPLAEKAAESAVKGTPGGDFEQTLKQALRELAR